MTTVDQPRTPTGQWAPVAVRTPRTPRPAPGPQQDREPAADPVTDAWQHYLAGPGAQHDEQGLTRPAITDEATRDRYLFGDCWMLAEAVHARTGWPYAVVADGAQDMDGQPTDDLDGAARVGWTHAGVLTPDGRVLDVDGAHEVGVWLDRHAHTDPDSQWDGDVGLFVVGCDRFRTALSLSPDAGSDLFAGDQRPHAQATAAALLPSTSGPGCPHCTR
jgi:hypothetical protein